MPVIIYIVYGKYLCKLIWKFQVFTYLFDERMTTDIFKEKVADYVQCVSKIIAQIKK